MLNPAVFPSVVSRVSAIWQNMLPYFLIYAKGGVEESLQHAAICQKHKQVVLCTILKKIHPTTSPQMKNPGGINISFR